MLGRRSNLVLIAVTMFAVLAAAGCGAPERADEGYILIFDYEGKFIPVEQLHESPPDACEETHWHASGTVTTLQSEVLQEPHPNCGFGADLILREVPMPDNYQGVQRTDPEWRYED